MTIQLATVLLPAGLQWVDEYQSQSVAQTRKRTLDGGQVVFYAGLTAGRTITLESSAATGWLRKSQVDAVHALANSPGAIFTLSLRGNAYQVMFRHDEPPAFDAAPLWPLANPSADDYFTARIRLVTV